MTSPSLSKLVNTSSPYALILHFLASQFMLLSLALASPGPLATWNSHACARNVQLPPWRLPLQISKQSPPTSITTTTALFAPKNN
ncbi:hypothetical protein J3F83DRAFT_742092 [Trichoderma novae-zelandiae]